MTHASAIENVEGRTQIAVLWERCFLPRSRSLILLMSPYKKVVRTQSVCFHIGWMAYKHSFGATARAATDVAS